MDIVDSATRSRMMASIRNRDTKPELIVRRYLHRLGFRYRLHAKLPGRPDLVLPKHKTVVFVHGCFWHRHEQCRFATVPKSNIQFWQQKLSANVLRDERNTAKLRELGWRVIVVWECQTADSSVLDAVAETLHSR